MATSQIIEYGGDKYYVEANGAKAFNRWVAIPNDGLWDEEVGTIWLRIGSDGKAYTGGKRTIDGNIYFFHDKGYMLSGWQSYGDDLYYLGTEDEGWAYTGWHLLEPDEDDVAPYEDQKWFYFKPSSGKAYRDDKTTIDGKTYLFSEEGYMLTGWQTFGDEDDLYYLGTEDEGWAYTGWHLLEPGEDDVSLYDDNKWFYFKPNSGKAYKDARKQINGRHYTFDENGVMTDKWLTGTPGAPDYQLADDSSAYYQEETGEQGIGWVYAYAPDNPEEDGDQEWYYLDSKGVPYNEQAKDSYHKVDAGWDIAIEIDGTQRKDFHSGVAARVIGNKNYLFDGSGKMLTGYYYLQGVKLYGGSKALGLVTISDNFFTGAYYYFNESDGSAKGQMMTGKQTIEYEDDTYHYYFWNNGQAYTNYIVDGSLYGPLGNRINEEGGGYRPYPLPTWITVSEKGSGNTYSDCTFLVNDSGKLKKNGTVTIDGVRYTVEHYKVVKEEAAD